jgi:hypothetical protein
MNALLLISVITLAILGVTRIVLVMLNPSREKKISGVVSSLLVFLPIFALFAYRDYYFGPTPLLIKIFVIILFFAFCVLIIFANYVEYKDCKECEVFSKKPRQEKIKQ